LADAWEGDQRQRKGLLVAAKHEVIDARVQIRQAAELQCGILGVDSLALADAAEACGYLKEGETVALVNIGLTSASIHFVKDGVSNFIRDVSWGARELIQAIAKDRRVDFEEAERQLQRSGEAPDPAKGQVPAEAAPAPPPMPRHDDPFGEAPPVVSGGSLLDPLDEELGGGGLSAPPRRPTPDVQSDVREVLHGPLGRMVAEVRRSFDYYEHQLYERPVDRIVLSGGVANLTLLRETLMDELGVEAVDVADPLRSSLMLGDDPAIAPLKQFPSAYMVAIGLAARGMADI
ncbi:MAG: pilus assembly protein PilM, partial [Candidatus Hydrogenedentes bacterium]|nr:pilus assembly protein PilM [Candidatus Hydrogenedentota bacterium]